MKHSASTPSRQKGSMLQGYEASSFNGFFPNLNTESELIKIMAETDLGEQQKTRFPSNESSMKNLFPASHEELTHSIDARFHQQSFELQNMTCRSVESFNQGIYSDVKNSQYLNPLKELLHMICKVGDEVVVGESDKGMLSMKWETAGRPSSSSSSSSYSVSSTSKSFSFKNLDIIELQRMKVNLLKLLEEVERRYKRYGEQMRSLVWSFEALAGGEAATPYLALASKAMSKHFRRLKDGIMEQIQRLKKVMGDKNHLVQQRKVFQLGGFMMDQQPWKRHRGLPERSVSLLRAWLFGHFLHPYPSDIDKHILALQTGLSKSQVSNWFINARVRLWRPTIEEMYMEEIKERKNVQAEGKNSNPNPKSNSLDQHDKELNLIVNLGTESDSGCLTTIVNARHQQGFTSYNVYNSMENSIGLLQHKQRSLNQ